MKTFKYFLCMAVLAFAGVTAFAQEATEYENGNRDENGKVVRGPYETNRFFDNWFVSAELGINTFTDRAAGFKPMITFPSLDVNVGKWLVPQYGLRLGYQGWVGKEDSTNAASQMGTTCTETFKYAYVHGDFLWNISNEFGGYKETRFWNFVPYIHAGYLRLYDAYDTGALDGKYKYGRRSPNAYDNELAAGVGLLNVLRISNRVNATIDLRHMVFSGRFHNWFGGSRAHNYSAMVGIQINLGKTNWKRVKTVPNCCPDLAAANAALAQAYADQDQLKAALAAATVPAPAPVEEKKDFVVVEYALGVPPLTIFFDINSTELNYTERQHLDFYVTNVIEKDPTRVFYLTGSADKATGTDDINNRLSRGRVENVIKVLKEEYNISADRLVLKGAVISEDHPNDPRLDRSVIIEH